MRFVKSESMTAPSARARWSAIGELPIENSIGGAGAWRLRRFPLCVAVYFLLQEMCPPDSVSFPSASCHALLTKLFGFDGVEPLTAKQHSGLPAGSLDNLPPCFTM